MTPVNTQPLNSNVWPVLKDVKRALLSTPVLSVRAAMCFLLRVVRNNKDSRILLFNPPQTQLSVRSLEEY